ncbi:MAG: hypothetical protein JO051_12045 [Acidobacteriaceae bacterium]|nr:hypothetical protein [Acidobacteriaceae bacterium]
MPAAYQTVQFVRGAGSVLLMLGLLGIAGSAAWERTRSARLAAIAGLWSGTVGMLMLVNFVLTLDFAFEAHATSVLNGAFLQSGMNDPGAFLVRNSLESILEIVTRLPIAATVLSFIGSLWNAWIKKQPRSIAALAAYVLPFMFLGGVLALWHIQSLPRVERPPFVIAGLLSACLALCAAHPIWSALSGNRSEPLIRQPGA